MMNEKDVERIHAIYKRLHWELSIAQNCCMNMHTSGLVHAMDAAQTILLELQNFKHDA